MNLHGNRMKTRVFYLALAVAAAAIAPSCVEEQIEQQEKPEVEIVGQVFEASHETMTKSTLFDLVPTWVEGDKILVSGADEEAECTFVADNKFQTGDEDVRLASPYYAIYPAVSGNAVDRETGIFTAAVPSVQEIPAAQNVAPGALVAVASSETTNLPFKNAVGLVKVNIGRNDIVSVLIESTNAEQKIAGKFTMNLDPDKNAEGEAPEIVMTEGVATVELKPAEGAFAAGTYYATVLPCAIDGVKVTFTRLNGESEEAVTVQKATATTIARNSGIDLGDFFLYEIGTAQELLAWNRAAAKWTAWDVVRLTADIDCADVITSDNWTPNTFTGVFDGNEKTIDNFVITKEGPAAFFEAVSGGAAVSNLTFGEGCSFTTTLASSSSNRVYAASLATVIKETATIRNIINKGSVTADAAATGGTKGNYIGGICSSYSSTGAVTGCQNHGAVTFSAVQEAWMNCGGLFGEVTKEVTLKDCTNYGYVQYNGTNTNNKTISLAGISASINSASFENCVNLGKIECNATAKHTGGTNIGGIVGMVNGGNGGTITDSANGSKDDATLGALTNNSPTGGQVRIGGFIGYIEKKNFNITSFKNYGKVTNNGTSTSQMALGGVVGLVSGVEGTPVVNTVSACENHGAVENKATISHVYLGGIAGWLKYASTSFASVSNAASVINNGAVSADSQITAGGIVGYAYGGTDNTITVASNTGAIENAKGANSANSHKSYVQLGGIVGLIDSGSTSVGCDTKNGITNTGNITNKGQNCDSAVGGIVGAISVAAQTNVIKNCHNSGVISKSGWLNNKVTAGHGFGGILGYHYASGAATLNISSCSNEGAVSKTGGAVSDTHVGGIAGGLFTSEATVNVSSCTNSGDVTQDTGTNAGDSKFCYTGGIVGHYVSAGKVSGCTNSGTITNKVSTSLGTSASPCIRFGGIVGNAQNGMFTDCTNTGAVVDASTSYGGNAGGIAGFVSTREVTMTNCDNEGDVTVLFNSENRKEKSRSEMFVGGIIGRSMVTMTLTGCDNSGAVINNCESNVNKGKTAIGGLVGLCYANTITNCHVIGNVTNNCPDTGNELVAGFVGQIEADKVTNISNSSVNSTVSTKLISYSGMFVGRLTDRAAADKGGITTTLSNIYVRGTFNGTELKADAYTSFCYGTSSDYKDTANISYGAYVAPAE